MTQVYEEDTYYRFSLFVPSFMATCGVMRQARDKSCYWVLDCIASYAPSLAVSKTPWDYMIVAEVLLNDEDSSCVFRLSDEMGHTIEQPIEFTDLRKPIKWWLINETVKEKRTFDPKARTVILLPEEY
jgi:hypothetical protein